MLFHYNLTLNGSPQQLSSVLAAETGASAANLGCRAVQLQPQGDNANPVYVGARSDVSATDYGFRLEAGTAGVPPAPWLLGEHDSGPLKLSDFWVIGTDAEVLHILIEPF